jgi:hypothetical protein
MKKVDMGALCGLLRTLAERGDAATTAAVQTR